KVYTLRESEAGDPVAGEVVQLDADCRLVVRQVGQRAAGGLDPVSDGWSGMRDRRGVEPSTSDLPRLVLDVVEDEGRRHVTKLDREQRCREVPRQPLVEAPHGRGR